MISDTSQFAPGVPAITYGLRGIAYYEVHLTGPNRDLHSGVFGGGVTNPAIALAKMLSAIIDADGRIQLAGFYDDVVPLTEREREEFRALPFDEAAFKKELGVDGVTGEKGFSTLERRWARPTFDVCGLTSGYQGEGAKTVLPSPGLGQIQLSIGSRSRSPESYGSAARSCSKRTYHRGSRWNWSTTTVPPAS